MDKFACLHAFTKVVEDGGFAAAGRAFYERAQTILNDLAEAEGCVLDEHEQPGGN